MSTLAHFTSTLTHFTSTLAHYTLVYKEERKEVVLKIQTEWGINREMWMTGWAGGSWLGDRWRKWCWCQTWTHKVDVRDDEEEGPIVGTAWGPWWGPHGDHVGDHGVDHSGDCSGDRNGDHSRDHSWRGRRRRWRDTWWNIWLTMASIVWRMYKTEHFSHHFIRNMDRLRIWSLIFNISKQLLVREMGKWFPSLKYLQKQRRWRHLVGGDKVETKGAELGNDTIFCFLFDFLIFSLLMKWNCLRKYRSRKRGFG